MYFKLLYIAFLMYTLSQVNLAENMEDCDMCYDIDACLGAQIDSEDQSLPIDINYNPDLGGIFGVLNTSHWDTYNIFESCDENANYKVTWNKKKLDEIKEAVRAIGAKKIEFPDDRNNCVTIKEIKEIINEVLNDTRKDQVDAFYVDLPVSSTYNDTQGLQSLGDNEYNLFSNCTDEASVISYFSSRIEVLVFINKFIRQLAGIKVDFKDGKCSTYKEIGETIQDWYIKNYPLNKTKIETTEIPNSVRSAVTTPLSTEVLFTRGIMKFGSQYMETLSCDSLTSVTLLDNALAQKYINDWALKVGNVYEAVVTDSTK